MLSTMNFVLYYRKKISNPNPKSLLNKILKATLVPEIGQLSQTPLNSITNLVLVPNLHWTHVFCDGHTFSSLLSGFPKMGLHD